MKDMFLGCGGDLTWDLTIGILKQKHFATRFESSLLSKSSALPRLVGQVCCVINRPYGVLLGLDKAFHLQPSHF